MAKSRDKKFFCFYLFSFQTSVSINAERAAKLYSCKFCNEGPGFKWQSELYKHCVFRHFNEEIRQELPEDYPNKCPKCDYTARNRTTMTLHYGITHKVVVTYIEKAMKDPKFLAAQQEREQQQQQQPTPIASPEPVEPPPSSLTPSSSSSLLSSGPQQQQLSLEYPFKCPLCSLIVSPAQRSDHLCVHFKDKLSQVLPSVAPYACPLCLYVGTDHNALIRHFGGFHKFVNEYLKDYLESLGEDHSHIGASDLPSSLLQSLERRRTTAAIIPAPNGAQQCRLCDSLPTIQSNSEFHKHLTETHFLEKILEEVPEAPLTTSEDESNNRLFKCNKPSCEFSATTRSRMLFHFGVYHRYVSRSCKKK